MKKTFFKFGLFLSLGITTAVFYSCSKDDNGSGAGSPVSSITATNVVNSSSTIATVKAELDNGSESDVIAEAPYQNSGFSLQLPATVAAKYLSAMGDEVTTGITVSDKTVKTAGVFELYAYDKNNNFAGFLLYSNVDPSVDSDITSGAGAMWIYVDRDVTIKGQSKDVTDTEEDIEIYDNVILKKGWNIVYYTEIYSKNQSTGKETYTVTYSNQKPSGVTLKWYFYGFSYSTSAPALKSTTSLSKINLFSKIKRR